MFPYYQQNPSEQTFALSALQVGQPDFNVLLDKIKWQFAAFFKSKHLLTPVGLLETILWVL